MKQQIVPANLELNYQRVALSVSKATTTPHNHACRADVVVKGVTIDAIIDTGAVRTLLSHNLYLSLRKLLGTMSLTEITLMSASDGKCKLVGEIDLPFTMMGHEYVQRVLVAEMKFIELLVGLDFLHGQGAMVDLKNNQLCLPNHAVPLRTTKHPESRPVRLAKGLSVWGGRMVLATCICETWPDRTPAFFETKVTLGDDVRFEEVLVEPRQGIFQVPLRNYSQRNTNLKSQVYVGCLQQLKTHLVRGEEVLAVYGPEAPTPSWTDEDPTMGKAWMHHTDRYEEEANIRVDESNTLLSSQTTGFQLAITEDGCGGPRDEGQGDSRPRQPDGRPCHDVHLVASKAGCPKHLTCVLPEEGLSRRQAREAGRLLRQYEDVFVGPDGKVGQTSLVEHTIDTGDARPFRIPVRRLGPVEREIAEEQVANLLKDGKIVPSHSPWASPLVLVKKKDGSPRLCCDYRKLNNVTVKDSYPLPRIDDILMSLGGCEYLSSMDLASGYYQVAIAKEDQPKTAIATYSGLYQWVVMPFGLTNAPATFERLMDYVLGPIKYSKCMLYLDDVVVKGEGWKEQVDNLDDVFSRLRDAGLKLKPSKCNLFRREVQYLGHVVSKRGVEPDPQKVECIVKWHSPVDLKGLKAFLGTTGYYRSFIKDYSDKAVCLNNLTKKGVRYEWNDERQTAFETLKEDLMSKPILSFPTRHDDYVLDTDCSNFALGSVLSQIQNGTERVIAYCSKSLNEAQSHYCTTKRELFAIKYSIFYFRHYLKGTEFLVRTDHSALKWLQSYKDGDDTMARWNYELQGYRFKIAHRAGKLHGNCDGLSRITVKCPRPDCPECKKLRGMQLPGRKARGKNKKEESDGDQDHGDFDYLVDYLPMGGQSDEPAMGSVAALLFPQILPPGVPCEPPGSVQDDEGSTLMEAAVTRAATRRAQPKVEVRIPSQEKTKRGRGRPRRVNPAPIVESTPEVVPRRRRGRPPKAVKATMGPPKPPPNVPKQSKPPPAIVNRGQNDRGPWVEGAMPTSWADAQAEDEVLGQLVKLKTEFGVGAVSKKLVPTLPVAVRKYCTRLWRSLQFRDGVLCRVEAAQRGEPETVRRLVPRGWRREMFELVHGGALGGHLGFDKIYPVAKARYFWVGMAGDFKRFLKSCHLCAQIKPLPHRNTMPLNQEIASRPWERLAMDVLGPMEETSRGNKFCLVVQDYFSKWIEVYPLPDQKAETVARCLLDLICHFGCPERLHSDRGTNFQSRLISELCELLLIKKTRTSSYAPYSDGMVERSMRTLKGLISPYVKRGTTDWDLQVPIAAAAYRATVHGSTGYSPNRVLLGRESRLPLDLVYGDAQEGRHIGSNEYVKQLESRTKQVWQDVRNQLKCSAEVQRKSRLKIVKGWKYEIRDLVYRWLPPARKFDARWAGPCTVIHIPVPGLLEVEQGGRRYMVNANNVRPFKEVQPEELAP